MGDCLLGLVGKDYVLLAADSSTCCSPSLVPCNEQCRRYHGSDDLLFDCFRCWCVSDAARSIVVFKDDEDKIMALDKYKLLAASGPTGDRVAFTEFVQKNVHLYELKNNIALTVKGAANWTRYAAPPPTACNHLQASRDAALHCVAL